MTMHIVTTHKNSDFDALASVIAATLFYPECIGVIPSATNRNVEQFLSTHKTAFNLLLPNEVDFAAVNRLTVVDTNQWHRLDRMKPLQLRDDVQVDLWDHHVNVPGDIEAEKIYAERIGATVSLFVREMRKQQIIPTPLEATVLLLGLYEDTGHLSFPSTTVDDARAAVYLLENGADLNVAPFFLNPPYEKAQQEALFVMMQKAERHHIGSCSVGFCHLHPNSKVPNLAEVVQLCRRIMGLDALFCLLELEDRHTIIGRSNSESINVGRLFKELGGGGHPGAGSATIRHDIAIPEVSEKKLFALLNQSTAHTVSAADLMSFPVISVGPTMSMREVQETMEEKDIRGLVVMEGDSICGIINLWDLKRVKKIKQWDSPVKAFMSRDVVTIPPTLSPKEITQLIIEKEIGYLPVVHEEKVIGIVTRTDILGYYYGHLEPLRGKQWPI